MIHKFSLAHYLTDWCSWGSGWDVNVKPSQLLDSLHVFPCSLARGCGKWVVAAWLMVGRSAADPLKRTILKLKHSLISRTIIPGIPLLLFRGLPNIFSIWRPSVWWCCGSIGPLLVQVVVYKNLVRSNHKTMNHRSLHYIPPLAYTSRPSRCQ